MKKIILLSILAFVFNCQKQEVPFLYEQYTEPVMSFYSDADELKKGFAKEFQALKDAWKAVDDLPHAERTIENTILKYDELSARLYLTEYIFPAYVSPSKTILKAAQECEKAVDEWTSTLSLRKPTYEAIKHIQEKYGEKLKGEIKRSVEEDIKSFERSGILLSEGERKQLEKINQELAELSQTYSINIREDKSKAYFTEEELQGVPESTLKQWKKGEDGRYALGMDYPTYFAIIDNAVLSGTRKKMNDVYYNRAYPKNIEILENVLALKKQKAEMLGYPSIRDYILEDRMVGSAKNVDDFLVDLAITIRPAVEANRARLTEENDGKTVQLWDIFYLKNQIKKREYEIDEEEVRQYFPMDQVLEGCQQLYSDLFSIEFEEVQADVWHEDVKKLLVKSEGKTIAAIFLDLFPREDKYSHAAQFGLRKGRYLGNGQYESPIVSLVCNFTKPTEDKPSLMTADEVNTYFHEFGHALHSCLTTAKLAGFSGTSVKRDFVEAPSQMFEQWLNDSSILQRFAKHYKTGEPMPKKLIDKLVEANYLMYATRTIRQVFYASYDQSIHGKKLPSDTTQLWYNLEGHIYGYPSQADSHRQAAFGHLVSGYSAQYYGYLYSEVMAADMFSLFREKGLLNKNLGMAFRNKILAKGGSEDPRKMVEDFLGRPVSSKNFLSVMK